jgi:hypothetical protein
MTASLPGEQIISLNCGTFRSFEAELITSQDEA